MRSAATKILQSVQASSKPMVRAFSMFASQRPLRTEYSSFINKKGQLDYVQTYQEYPYYTPPALLDKPARVSTHVFNQDPISDKNPYGIVADGSNHRVYRAKAPNGEVHYLKDLSQSRNDPLRDEESAQWVACLETFSTWLMYQIFGPDLIPHVFPVKYKDPVSLKEKWGIASAEIKYLATLDELAKQLGYSDLEITYERKSALKVIQGQTFLLLPEGDKIIQVRVKGRIALKVALRMLVAHADLENHHKNVFMKLIEDPVHYRVVACPGMFDLGSTFFFNEMNELIELCKAGQQAEFALKLAINHLDAHIPELNVLDYDKITDRYLAKQAAFKRIAGLPWENIQLGLDWLRRQAPQTQIAKENIEAIEEYLRCSRLISNLVLNHLTALVHQEDVSFVSELSPTL